MKTQVAIIGGGPGGSSAAIRLLAHGIRPVIIEKDMFPRYHIGESMTGGCGEIVRALGFEDLMIARNYPVKHGVKVYGKHPWFLPVMARDEENQLLNQTTWQVPRSEFDAILLNEAVRRGAVLVHGQAITPVCNDAGVITGIEVRMTDGGSQLIETEFLLDCSGLATFLANKGVTGPKYLGSYDRQIAIFSQVTGGYRDNGTDRDSQPGNTLIYYRTKYQWGWWIPLNDEIISVGIVLPAAYFIEKQESKHQFLTRELKELHPNLSERLPEFKLVEETRAIKNYSYQVKNFTGKGFICIGDAHRFLDPIFSFGLNLTMKEAEIAVPYVLEYLNGQRRGIERPFADYERYVEKAQDILEDTLDGFWEHPAAFAVLTHLKYFEYLVDIFAGRIYDGQPSEAVNAFRSLLQRERSYQDTEEFSIPIGSRYHPERAAIWVDNATDIPELSKLLPD